MSPRRAVPDGTPWWTDREDQLSAGFRAVRCTGCEVTVLVRKMHPAQTSTQWTAEATCAHLARDEAGRPGERCPQLSAAIEDAVRRGDLPTEPT